MKRKNRKTVHLFKNSNEAIAKDFFSNCSLIEYNSEFHGQKKFKKIEAIIFEQKQQVSWLNIYGFQYSQAIKQIVQQNNIDEFLINLTTETNHRNKVIELTNCFFLTLKSPFYEEENPEVQFEQLIFVVNKNLVWTIQEVKGDHFEHIRKRLQENIGLVRKKEADYLFYLLVEAIIENYYLAYEKIVEDNEIFSRLENVKPKPEFAEAVELNKKRLYQIKKTAASSKEAISQLEKMDFPDFNTKYFMELKEQIAMLNDAIDFNLQQLESSINLIFSIQSHRLNEVMKTLTIFSVIFIPLTFLAGIYGMNFKNIPELESQNGYFILLGIMLLITVFTVFYVRRKKWFD